MIVPIMISIWIIGYLVCIWLSNKADILSYKDMTVADLILFIVVWYFVSLICILIIMSKSKIFGWKPFNRKNEK